MARTKVEIEGRRQGDRIRLGIGAEILRLRLDCGISQVTLARRAGISQQMLSKIELGEVAVSIDVLSRIAVALGADLSLKLYPNTGPQIRDRTQTLMIQALLSIVDPGWKPFLEVPLQRPVRGFIDLVLGRPDDGVLVATEAESGLRRLEQMIRWSNLKADALAASDLARFAGRAGAPGELRVSRLLLVRSTRANRDVADAASDLLRVAYPSAAHEAYLALTNGAAWPGPAILWADVGGTAARILERPPRTVRIGR